MDSDGSEYEYGSDYGGSQDEENEDEMVDETAIKIANTFYEADDCKTSDPARALELYLQVLSLQQSGADSDAKDPENFHFKSLENVVKLCATLNKPDAMLEHYRQVLTLLPQVTRNEFTDTVNSILDLVSTLPGARSIISKTYEITLEALKTAHNERLWFQTNVKLGRLYLEMGEVASLKRVLKELHQSCKTPDGHDDLSKATSLLDVYCLEVQLCTTTHDTAKLKSIYPKTLDLDAAISDPRTMGLIREEGGKMYLAEGLWLLAYNEFFESFRNYQEAGNSRAKQCLKYVVLANMLASSDINPFDSREAKVFKDVDEISAMLQLRDAYGNNDITTFEKILNHPKHHIITDPLIKRYLDPLVRNIRSHVLVKVVAPYKTIKLASIAKEMNIAEAEVEGLAVTLIHDNILASRKIDQCQRVLVDISSTTREVAASKTVDALAKWTSALVKANQVTSERNLLSF
ncbi:hypothetical protein, variant [Aphanomyces invadans]|uniref:PCI domain-containing protein n=1 Tax=Aphanomyces invadans TaxID=157072 RepID=A0A024US64_9STRA|nr:hypothetical protein, variant [Aphanomyces invadans]ETW09174.1 hypothetical protein, variant [Aphanomyces invadans]|eukprot:XP_008862979.1 hypothetical protein, variant [Aphanomyces invadans]